MGIGASDILARVQAEREQMVSFLRELTLAESPSSSATSQRAARALILRALQDLTFRTIAVPGRTSGGQLYARPRQRRPGAPIQLLVGHYDTVWPVGTLAQMPFEYDGRIVKGPGVFDMKGGLVQLVFALKVMAALDRDPTVSSLETT